MEPLHGHHWQVTLTVTGPGLDHEGLLCDFHALEAIVDLVIAPYQNANLNTVPPYCEGVNPTAELVCRTIAEGVRSGIEGGPLASQVRLARVRLTEAPGCAVTLSFPPPPGGSDLG